MNRPDPYDICAQQLSGLKQKEILDFWQGFTQQADALDDQFSGKSGAAKVDILALFAPLQSINKDLVWECGPSAVGHQMCVTAGFHPSSRQTARAVINAAPNLARWSFSDALPACDPDLAIQLTEVRTGAKFTLTDLQFSLSDNNKIDAIALAPDINEATVREAETLLSVLLGETIERDWLGKITLGTSKPKGMLARLKPSKHMTTSALANSLRAFTSLIDDIKQSLPDQPFAQQDIETRKAVLLDVNAAPLSGRGDLFTLVAPNALYATATLTPIIFASANHSKHGEYFTFLRIPRGPDHPFDDLQDRVDIEDVLNDALQSANAGGLVGSGQGRENVYIDLALHDLARALPIIGNICAHAPWGDTATLHFYDAGLIDTPLPTAALNQKSV